MRTYEEVRENIYLSIMIFDYDLFEKAFKCYLVNYARNLNVKELTIDFFVRKPKRKVKIAIAKLFIKEFKNKHSELLKDIKISI